MRSQHSLSTPVGAADFRATESLAGRQLATALDLPTFGWASPKDGEGPAILTAAPGEEALLLCGGNEAEQTIRVQAPDGVAYCLSFDPRDAESVYRARQIAVRLVGDRVPTKAEDDILYLETQGMFASPDSATYDAIQKKLDTLWAELSPAQAAAMAG